MDAGGHHVPARGPRKSGRASMIGAAGGAAAMLQQMQPAAFAQHGAPAGSSRQVTSSSMNAARRADMYAVGRFVSARALRERQGDSTHTMLMTQADGMPIKEALQAQFRLTRDKIIWDAGIFLLHFAILLVLALNVNDVHSSFVGNDTVRQRIANKAFPGAYWRKTFFDVGQTGEMYNFLNQGTDGNGDVVGPGPLLSELFATNWYDAAAYTDVETPFAFGGLARVLGGVEVRFYRVSPDSCTPTPDLPGIDGDCFGGFAPEHAFTGVLTLNNNTYDFSTKHTSSVSGWYGGVKNMRAVEYGSVAYSAILPAGDYQRAQEIVQQWEDDGLVDDGGIRAIAFTFNVYNTNTRFVTVARLLLEIVETANVVPSGEYYTLPVPELFLTSTVDQIMLLLFVLYMMGWVYFFQKEARRFYWSKPRLRYFASLTNVFECALLLAMAVFIGSYCDYLAFSVIRAPINANSDTYFDMYDGATSFGRAFVWGGAVGLMSCLKIFRFLSISKRMNTLWLTLFRAAPDLASFVTALMLCMLGFSFFGQHAFGYRLHDYKDFSSATTTLLRYIMGDFEYNSLSDARPWIAWVYFGLYVCIVNVIVINIIIAIVTKYFSEVHAEVNRVDKWKESTARLEQVLVARFTRWRKLGARRLFYSCCCCATAHGRVMYNRRRLLWCRLTNRFAAAIAGCSRWCSTKILRRPTGDAAEQEAAPRDPAALAEYADGEQLAQWEVDEILEDYQSSMERRFLAELKKCAQLAKRVHNVDMFSHFERLYEDTPGSDSLYVGIHELCSLLRKRPCNPTSHRDCEARHLLTAFHEMKLVLMVGRCQKHKPIADDLTEYPARVFAVEIRTRIGFKTSKKIVVDEDRGVLLIFNSADQYERQLPLTQLIQIEKSMAGTNQLSLIFTSQGVPMEDEETLGSLEIQLRIVFKTEFRRDEFLEMVMRTQASLHTEFEAIMGQLGDAMTVPTHEPAKHAVQTSTLGGHAVGSAAGVGLGGSPSGPQTSRAASRPSLAASLSTRFRTAIAATRR